MQEDTISIKIVLLGDGNVGKTSLLVTYTTDVFPQIYVPTIFDNYQSLIKYDQHFVKLLLWDTAGQEEYQRLRSLSYPNTDIFLICFSLVDPQSFNRALNKWLPQVNENCPNALKFFVGTKSDLFKKNQKYIMMREKPIILPHQIINRKIEAHGYQLMTCSAYNKDGLNDVFNEAIRQVLQKRVKYFVKRKVEENPCQII